MALQYYGGAYELIACASQDEAGNIARDRLGPLLKSTDEEVFSCVYAGPPGAKAIDTLEQIEELWRGGS